MGYFLFFWGHPTAFSRGFEGFLWWNLEKSFFVSFDVIFMPSKFETSLLLLKLFWKSSSPLICLPLCFVFEFFFCNCEVLHDRNL